MADTTYIVEIRLETKGEIDPQKSGLGSSADKADLLKQRLNGASQALQGLSRMTPDILGRFTGALEWAASKAWDVASAIGKIAIGAGIAAVTWGVMKLNNELETTRTSLGAIFTAQGQAGDLNSGLTLASDTIVKMRRDAALLPGEFKDLLNIMTTTAIPGFQAGLDVTGLRELSSKLMATGVVASMPLDQVAREAAQLMSGRSGGHNVLGMRLMGLHGEAAKKFNEMTAADRLEKINSELDKYKGAITVFGQGWEGLSSTAVDTAKEWIRMMTEPLFERLKGDLMGINEWFDQNQSLLNSWARYIGDKLVEAWDWGKRKIQEWWPLLRDFAEGATKKLAQLWKDWEPTVQRIAEWLKEALADPNGTIDKLILLAKLWAGAKVAQGLGGMGMNLAVGGAQLFGGLVQMGVIGGGGAAAGAGAAAAGAGGAGAAAAGGGGILAGTGAALAGLAVPVAATTAAVGALGAAVWQGTLLYEDLQDIQRIEDREIHRHAQSTIEAWGAQGEAIRRSTDEIMLLEAHGNEASAAIWRMELAAWSAARALDAVGKRETEGKGAAITAAATTAIGLGALKMMGEARTESMLAAEKARKEKGAKHPGGGGGTRIQKVEIVVTSNQSPNRIARVVTDELAKMARLRRTSPHVRNYSVLGRRGGEL